ncbi:MAG: 16S rRNA (uracil(1498)-N(3))-methyltransferase [Gemmatimonadetes bacterium]|nr:16S rRNA (uracil(1498)-N(3))-methyltransferase [Gemmatimonadota bacterium]
MTHAEPTSRRPTLFAPGVSGRDAGEVLALGEDESRHIRALRLAPGSPVRLTDGRGALWEARLMSVGSRSSDCVLDVRSIPASPLPVELAFGVGHKTHIMWLLEKATEMGVSRLQPLESERTVSVADAGRSDAFWTKAGRRVVSAMKQSGGAWLPEIEPLRSLGDYLLRLAESGDDGPLSIRLDRAGVGLQSLLTEWSGSRRIVLLVGPEGGWSSHEASRMDDAGFRVASLGQLMLRFETAAIAGLAVVAQHGLKTGGTGDGLTTRETGG